MGVTVDYSHIFTKDMLLDNYCVKNLSKANIAKMFNVDIMTVKKYLKKYNLNKNEKKDFSNVLTKKLLINKYIIQNLSITKIADEFNINYGTVYNYLHKYKIKIKKTGSFLIGRKQIEHSKLMMGEGNPLFGVKRSKEICDKISSTRLDRIKSGKIISTSKGIKNPELSKKMKRLWQKDWFKKKMVAASRKAGHNSPNKLEQKFMNILNNLIPKTFKFVGDGKLIIDRFNPDFCRCDGGKQLIELFGDYWHNLDTWKKRDKRKLKIYKNLGYETLIVWEHELKNLELLQHKILKYAR